MADIIHRIGFRAPIEKVYSAISTIEGLSTWWTKETSGTAKQGEKITFTFRSLKGDLLGEMKMKVMKQSSNERVLWKVEAGPPDWIGTEIEFKLQKVDDMVILLFAHKDWEEATESMAHCSMKWAVFLMSMKQAVETGRGKPSPNDIKIDNWN